MRKPVWQCFREVQSPAEDRTQPVLQSGLVKGNAASLKLSAAVAISIEANDHHSGLG
jgi:hypothetical protein